MNNLVRSVDETKGTESLSNEIRKLYAEIVLQAVVDRISNGVDLAERTNRCDLTRHPSKHARRTNVPGLRPTGGTSNDDLWRHSRERLRIDQRRLWYEVFLKL